MKNYKNGLFGKLGLMLVVLFALMTVGCATRLGAFTVISTKNIDWSRAGEFKRHNKKVEGKDMYHIIIFIPTKFNVTIEDAVDNALGKVPGAIALVDAVLRVKSFYIYLLYGQGGYYIEGTALIDPRLAAADNKDESSYLVFYTEDGKDFKKKEVSQDEYLSYVAKK
ncbi:MAG: hypothetical protein Ta2G_08140 [Termitinemataceae bacterium]|nr:MAG: hypothetical protein Ta2G_08140 [Termitinemataceae bacterium]